MSTPPIIEIFPNPQDLQDAPSPPPGRERRNRRILLFIGVFTLCLAASLSYVWMRTPLYQSTASLLTVAPEEAGQPEAKTATIRQGRARRSGLMPNLTLTGPEAPSNQGGSEHVTLQRQILLGVPVFEEALRRLEGQEDPPELARLKVADLRKLLNVEMVPDTNMVELKAQGPKPVVLAPLVNAWIDAYQALREQTVRDAASTNRSTLEEESQKLEGKIKAKREALENFRSSHNILAGIDADNTPMLRLKGLNEAMNKAIDEQVKAKAKLEAIRAAIARGEPVVPKEEAAGLENLERRAQELREQQKDLRRRYTASYLAIHPQLKQIPEQLAQVEEQIRSKAENGRRALLSQTEQADASARQTVEELRQKIDGLKREVTEFSNRFAEQETMRADLDRLEEMHREVQAKLARAETRPKEPYPPLQVVERAYPPTQPSWPDYWRDSGISLGLSILVALACVWLHDFLTRAVETPAPAPAAMPNFQFYTLQGGLPGPRREEEIPSLPSRQDVPLALESPFPRELTGHEIRILWEAADKQTRQWIGLLLSGLTVEEALNLREDDVDRATGRIRIPGECPRTVPLAPRLKGCLGRLATDDDAEEMAASIHLAAIDSGLPEPETIDAGALRHTYIAHLVRQGIRLSELESVIGRLPAKNRATYGRLSPPGPGLSAERVPLVHPVLLDNDIA